MTTTTRQARLALIRRRHAALLVQRGIRIDRARRRARAVFVALVALALVRS